MVTSNAYNVYKNNSVNFASKDQLLLMLLDGAVKYAKLGKVGIEEKNIQKAHDNLTRTQSIFVELMVSLDLEKGGDWAKSLFSVYEFINSKLVEANIKKDVKAVDEVMPLIEDVRGIWNEAYKLSKQS